MIVDPDAVPAGAITAEFFQPVPRRNPEVVESLARIELDELSPSSPLHLQ